MIISYNWLNEWVKLDATPAETAQKMTELGMEVDEVKELTQNVGNIKVATVTDIEEKNLKKNRILHIDTGSQNLIVVTSDNKVNAGDRIAWAAPDTEILGRTLGKRQFDDVESIGMAISLEEIGLEEKSSGLLILDEKYKNGTMLKDIDLFSDSLIDFEVTPNRGDLLSHYGVARDLAAFYGKNIEKKIERTALDINLKELKPFDLKIESENIQSYYCASMDNVNIGESPIWLKVKLLKCGVRPLYNIVDITNYIMLDIGQPMHAFDLDKIDAKIVVRESLKGETIETLDGEKRSLPDNAVVIADSFPLAVAGVMGGISSKITESTKRIMFESAVFDPTSVRKTSKAMKLSTGASQRYERGVDRLSTKNALSCALGLTKKIASGNIDSAAFYDSVPTALKINLSYKKVSSYIGMPIKKEYIDSTLDSLKIRKITDTGDTAMFSPPSFRHDLKLDVDLIEEIARFYGYDKIDSTLPTIKLPSVNPYAGLTIANILASSGYHEVINYSFIESSIAKLFSNSKPIKISNPINLDQSVMRASLMPGLIGSLATNLNHGIATIKIFEMGTLFFPDGENQYLGILLGGNCQKNWFSNKRIFDFYDIKGIIQTLIQPDEIEVMAGGPKFLHPNRSASVVLNGEIFGYIGELHPDILIKNGFDTPVVVSEIKLSYFNRNRVEKYAKINKTVANRKDIAFVVDKTVSVKTILDAMLEVKFVLHAVPFDIYEGSGIKKNEKSVAFNLLLDGTANSSEELEELACHLEKKTGAKLRR